MIRRISASLLGVALFLSPAYAGRISGGGGGSAADTRVPIINRGAGIAPPGSNTYSNVTGITVPAGKWTLSGMAFISGGSGVSQFNVVISSYADNTQTDHNLGQNFGSDSIGTGNETLTIPPIPVTLAVDTIFYIKFLEVYSVSNGNCSGSITAIPR